MEGGYTYSLNPPPPLSTDLPETSSERDKASNSTGRGTHDVIRMERIRREKMSEFYATLQSFVPNLYPSATRTSVIDETIAYIKELEEMIKIMEVKKQAKTTAMPSYPVPLEAHRSSSVDITVSGRTAFFGICSPSRPGLVTQILLVFERNEAEVLASTVACHDWNISLTVTALAEEDGVVERLKGDLLSILDHS